jgi:SAM-dependent methyltransferase
MFEPSVPTFIDSPPCQAFRSDFVNGESSFIDATPGFGIGEKVGAHWLLRRWRRERRRRKVGRAYDMALEISRALCRSPSQRILDVGCGNGYIAHHLSAMLRTRVLGIDLDAKTEAAIDYRPFNGTHFPVESNSLDVVLFCYVLHHAQDLESLLNEVRRVLCEGGQVIVYEDNPESWWDRIVCSLHDRQWRGRTGPCTFNTEAGWRTLFEAASFEVVRTRSLSRGRNLAHPVSRRFFVMRLQDTIVNAATQ